MDQVQKILPVRRCLDGPPGLMQLTFSTAVGAMPTYLPCVRDANMEWECVSMSHDSLCTGMCVRNALCLISGWTQNSTGSFCYLSVALSIIILQFFFPRTRGTDTHRYSLFPTYFKRPLRRFNSRVFTRLVRSGIMAQVVHFIGPNRLSTGELRLRFILEFHPSDGCTILPQGVP